MASELTQQNLIDKIAAIDAQVEVIRAALASGTGSVVYTDHQIGNVSSDGSQQLEGLLAMRKVYQSQLSRWPKDVVTDAATNIEEWGEDSTDYIGDE